MARMKQQKNAQANAQASAQAQTKQTRPKKTGFNLPMCLAAVLFCLTLISVHFASGLYAKYISRGAAGSVARVISFGNLTITKEGNFVNASNSAIITPGVDLVNSVRVGFTGSEAATYVFVELKVKGWTTGNHTSFSLLSNQLQWSIAPGWTYLPNSAATGGGYTTYVYYRELGPNTAIPTADPAFSGEVIANTTITVSDTVTRTDLAALTDDNGSMDFRATVVQATGFADAAAAWASVSG